MTDTKPEVKRFRGSRLNNETDEYEPAEFVDASDYDALSAKVKDLEGENEVLREQNFEMNKALADPWGHAKALARRCDELVRELAEVRGEIIALGQASATAITGDPDDANSVGNTETALAAIKEEIRLGREAHYARNQLQRDLEAAHLRREETVAMCEQLRSELEAARESLMEAAKLKGELEATAGVLYRFQPPGSPPPGGLPELAQYVLEAARRERDGAYERAAQLCDEQVRLYDKMKAQRKANDELAHVWGEQAALVYLLAMDIRKLKSQPTPQAGEE
jgi:chromosome segregation ATPase